MYKKIWLLVAILSCMACDKQRSRPACRSQVCTLEFRSVIIRFVDKQGQPVVVSNYKAINMRTGRPVVGAGSVNASTAPGNYIVATDSNVMDLSEQGDNIQVSATNPVTGQSVSTIIKVLGGECACHIGKISGPEQLVFTE